MSAIKTGQSRQSQGGPEATPSADTRSPVLVWRRRIKFGLAALLIFAAGAVVGGGKVSFTNRYATENGSLPNSLDYSSVSQVYASLRDNYDGKLTEKQLLNGLKAGLAESTNDPYTEYFTAAEAKDFDNQLNNTFSGVGAELGKDKSGNLVVVSPIAGEPAAKAGLKAGDIITTINGQSTSGMAVDEAVAKIRGKAGTVVILGLVRVDKPLTLKITRQNIQVPSVETKILPGNIGYINIRTFGDDTATLMNKAAKRLHDQHVGGLILDLRGNPGGLLSAAVDTASQWLPDGKTILQEKRGSVVVDSYSSTGQHLLVGVPTVVLIDGGSASASEITAGALHDNKAAYLIGQKSYGKGVVQQIINFNDGSELKVTVASWYRPNGQNINHRGITPDKKVGLTQKQVDAGQDPQQDAAISYLQNR
jgi:carboxyl-terminal processing protease